MKSEDPFLRNSIPGEPPARLRDSGEGLQDPSAQWAISMLGWAEPYEPAPGRQERTWAKLQAADRLFQPRWLRFAVAGSALLFAGLFASAALAQWPGWLARIIHTAPTERPARSLAKLPVPTADRATSIAPIRPSVEEPAALAVAAPSNPAPGRARRLSKAATPEESEVLLGAMRALRVDHDPDRARTILSQYLAGHPKGALAEEALVMLVEAAVAHGDRDASALAARYFQLYPRGEFAVQVRRALAGTAAAQ
jgi:hypothetical protein